MKPDVLERLLMDSALGRLDPDVETLLADHLAGDPAAATQARELQSMVRLATDVIRTPLPAIELPGQIHRLVWRHRAEQVFALAASFVVGAGITALVMAIVIGKRKGYKKFPMEPANIPNPESAR